MIIKEEERGSRRMKREVVGELGGEEELDESFIVSAKFLINYQQKQ